MRKLSYSLNKYDRNGEMWDVCIDVHLNNGVILSFKTIEDYDDFISQMRRMREEIVENEDYLK